MNPNSITPQPNTQKIILLLGSTGFIGRQVRQGLTQMGYQLRTPSSTEVNFNTPDWQAIAKFIDGVDTIINMVGVMTQDSNVLEHVHHHTPVRIAQLAKRFHVKHWINLSALGADANHKVAFVGSKGRGDTALLNLAQLSKGFQVSIARPSLVFGRGGASCEMFLKLAKLPVLTLPDAGEQHIQPVHVNDVVQGLINLAITDCSVSTDTKSVINFTGSEPCRLKDYLTMMRVDIHNLPSPCVLPIPSLVAKTGIILLSPLLSAQNQSMMNQDSLTLLNQGSIADCTQFSQLLKRQPLTYKQFALQPQIL